MGFVNPERLLRRSKNKTMVLGGRRELGFCRLISPAAAEGT
jgi:hypothetical protein